MIIPKKQCFAILILVVILNSQRCFPISYQPNVTRLETVFKSAMPQGYGIVYTKVPRGLVVSIDEKYFFNAGEVRIKESSLYILDIAASIIKDLSNYCVIESHTEETGESLNTNWELSISRAGNIAEYITKCRKISSERIFFLGFGNSMPFKDNVAPRNGMNNRIDLVILEYEARR